MDRLLTNSSTAFLKASSSTQRQINPQAAASSAESRSPNRASPKALAVATNLGKKKVPPVSGMRPSLAKDWIKLADLVAITRSQAKARLTPAPAATPLTAAAPGKCKDRSRRTTGGKH